MEHLGERLVGLVEGRVQARGRGRSRRSRRRGATSRGSARSHLVEQRVHPGDDVGGGEARGMETGRADRRSGSRRPSEARGRRRSRRSQGRPDRVAGLTPPIGCTASSHLAGVHTADAVVEGRRGPRLTRASGVSESATWPGCRPATPSYTPTAASRRLTPPICLYSSLVNGRGPPRRCRRTGAARPEADRASGYTARWRLAGVTRKGRTAPRDVTQAESRLGQDVAV